MEIYIVRHAIAEDTSRSGGGDAKRELTSEGKQKMKEAAKGFAKLGRKVDRIFSSPLVRARQTAEILAAESKQTVEEMRELSPAHTPKDVCARLEQLAKSKSVMLVGHEPNCSELASYLLVGPSELDIVFKKGAICFIEADKPAQGAGTLVWHLSPQILRQLGK
jgi:phosphohistidine phosphatase